MFSESINLETKRVLEKIGKSAFVSNFYLAGGTALAIQLGHRESIDLDWFSEKEFANEKIKNELSKIGSFELNSEEENTVHGAIDNVKVSFLHYPYGRLFPLVAFEGINLADERDIAAMKIDAISSRGSKKDFIDLFFLLKKYSLEELLGFFEKKFKDIRYNKLHILKSLAYFEAAKDEPMPKMIENAGWEEIQKKISEKINEFLRRQTT
ncbi:MAG TPA: nucleotidyl transferase AbiEii/AbiGii toxin family protein [Candidatus Moranbacteria bacterium]|nr:nucleotidyl transferase AbiEii/AbiGii toxin family protein [Candidatus Moranbacteria bacterium]